MPREQPRLFDPRPSRISYPCQVEQMKAKRKGSKEADLKRPICDSPYLPLTLEKVIGNCCFLSSSPKWAHTIPSRSWPRGLFWSYWYENLALGSNAKRGRYEHKNQLLLHRRDGPHVGHGIRNMVPTRSAGTGHRAEVRGRSILAQNSSQMGSRAPRWGMHRCSGAFIHLAPPGRAVDVDGKRSKRRNGGGSSGDGIQS